MARPFNANRDIKIEASETAAGTYTLRTRGLGAWRRPELEIAGVPEAALNGAGGVVNLIAEYTVSKAELLAGETVGNVLAVSDDGPELLLAVRAVASGRPSGGLWSKLTGGDKGVLRLVDATGASEGPPLTAIATMLVHRALVRSATADEAGAREELEAAIATFPGEPGAGVPPSIAGSGGTYNWQNHLAYLELARLAGDDLGAATEHFAEALARSPELARRELGASVEAVLGLDEETVAMQSKLILEHNFGAVHRGAGPSAQMVTVASPIWELDDGRSSRRASVVPAALLAIYYEGPASERLRREGAVLAARILARDRKAPWRATWIARDVRRLWIRDDAPRLETVGPTHPAHGVVSLVLADLARCFEAGATEAEILARYAPRSAEAAPSVGELASLDTKLETLAAWEADRYVEAMSA
jgi:hypothetical protein